jgi:Rps23 Pro-64 3,4-dihydroxylase Tpa1-like proline 4-hydroxylase
MKYNIKTDKFAVFDDVLDEQHFSHFVRFFCGLEFRKPQQWQKVWRLSDGENLGGDEYKSFNAPFNNPIDWIHSYITNLSKDYISEICGKEGEDWDHIVYRPYIYPAGSRISWHDDYGYSAACIFYCHTEWSPYWGGELLIANTPPLEEIDLVGTSDEMIMRQCSNKILNHFGNGYYISCLPNRLVFSKGSVWHSINRVDQSAGEKLRCSVVAFFKKSKPD